MAKVSQKERLSSLFFPASVAVIGASRDPDKVGHVILSNIIKGGYKGDILPVNPNATRIKGLRAYPSVTDAAQAHGPVELVVVCVPAPLVPGIIEECGAAGVKAAIVVSAGFREIGKEGLLLERRLVEAARRHRIVLLGPNCLGLISSEAKLNATFARFMPQPGNVALMSQSGALCTSILDWSAREGIGFCRFVSLGNKAGVNEEDLLRKWRGDRRVGVIAVYLEQVADGRRFIKEARLAAAKKPLIILKAGVTDAGARAASSHTGSLAGSDKAYRAAVLKTNSLAADTMEDFFDLISLSSLQPLPRKGGVAIITNAGGPGILTADACEKAGLMLASFSRRTVNQLAKVLPAAANLYNPVDILGDAAADRYLSALKMVAADSGVGSIIAVLTPQAVTDIEGSARAIVELANSAGKPVVGCFLGGKDVEAGVAILSRGGIPNFRFPERAAAALAKLYHYSERRRQKYTKPPVFKVSREKVRRLVEENRRGGSLHIGGFQALDILKFYGIKVPRGRLAHSPAEAASIAAGIGFPVVMKVVSPNILHKSDVGGVRTGVDSQEEARRSFEEIKASVTATMPDALFLGVAVQEQVMGAREVIIGSTSDPQFGPLLMFGLGGIYVEILKDVSFRIAPICSQEAWQMVTEIKSYPLLAGSRGEKPADCEAIVDVLLRCSQLVMDFKEIVEMDLNPLLVGHRGTGAWVADARLVIRP